MMVERSAAALCESRVRIGGASPTFVDESLCGGGGGGRGGDMFAETEPIVSV